MNSGTVGTMWNDETALNEKSGIELLFVYICWCE